MKEVEIKVEEREDGTVKYTYQSDGIDDEADGRIKEMAAKRGLVWTGQGYYLITGVRDICYDKPSGK